MIGSKFRYMEDWMHSDVTRKLKSESYRIDLLNDFVWTYEFAG